ncbi:MAG: 50S ribosomal protein L11 methyltransferase [Gammaproteobacteria bacterium]|nr:50S ribosomal protein L11 methyltransferase [Gammaproteobacteria bacterium]MDH3409420.1 50S ribosomal protein L11 methyltransferase [Gammaproteobacteria bacterium]MDH3552152.1 50S ribosomal protein L11 methyltransferase [Gammaproteobacteria bacterium]
MDWRQFVMDLETLSPDRVEEVFVRNGAQSITFTDAGDRPVLEPAPGETPKWQEMRITGLFSPAVDLGLLRDDLKASLDIDVLPSHEVAELEDRAWEREWLKDLSSLRFGRRLWVLPGDTKADNDDAVIVRLDPGLAFGTGTHATTALCLEWLDAQELDGLTMLDYGCGSGILAIAALKLGCANAVAMDIDPQALTSTLANARHNGVERHMLVTGSADGIQGQFDIVVANILAGPIVRLAGQVVCRVKSGCLLALSGILSGQVDDVLTAYDPWIEFDVPALREQGGQTWARLTGRRIEG